MVNRLVQLALLQSPTPSRLNLPFENIDLTNADLGRLSIPYFHVSKLIFT